MLSIAGYQIYELIYKSDNSLVYRGIRRTDSQPVILKFLKENYPTPSELTRYHQEYEITHELNLVGVVKAYSIEKYQNTLVIILEDFGGKSLKRILEQEEKISLVNLLSLAIQITEALGQIHAANIIHKDINPSNIIWNQTTHQLKIIDFGIASRLPRENPTLKNPEQLEGTLPYISPEQTGRMNRALDYRTDLYSLGITFYELLTGKLPFKSDSAMELVHCHIAKTPKPVVEINPDVPQLLSNIVMKLMAKNVENRYQSAFGIKNDLEKCQKSLENLEDLSGLTFELAQNDFSGRLQIPQKLYGREREIETLLQAFERASQGAGEMILIAGYSGVGKTALVHEVHKPMTEKHGYFAAGKFDQYQHNIPYSAISQLFNELCNYLLSESVEQLKQWQQEILTAVGSKGQVLIDVIEQLKLIIGAQPTVEAIPPQEAQNRFNSVFQSFFQTLCRAEHPLILFIDDLQWADPASLQLLKLLMADTNNHHFLIIGAYRDNEVYATHPLMISLAELQEAEILVNMISLSNLSHRDVNALIADALRSEPLYVRHLTDLVYEKTQGNAFFTHEFLKSLYEQALLEFDVKTQKWRWEIDKIAALNITDNVVELLARKINQFPSQTILVLKLAACIGNQFDLKTLSIISQHSQSEVLTHLWSAIKEGVILPQDDNYKWADHVKSENKLAYFKFLHDRVQQAAYVLIEETEKKTVHLSIGQLLLDNASLETEDEQLFQILDHLNIARSLIVETHRKIELAQLNLRAGIKAKQATAYVAALQYIIIGINYVDEQAWEKNYDLVLTLHKEWAELEFLNGHFDESERVIRQTVERVKTPLEKAEVLHILIVQYTLSARYSEAIQTGRQALALLDIDLADDNFEPVRDQEMLAIKTLIGDRTIASLFDLPIMTDPIYTMAVKLLITMGPPCYRSHQRLWGVIVAKVVHLTLQYGNVPQIGYSHTAYGGLLGYVWQDYNTGKELGELATRLMNEKFTDSSAAQSVFYLMIGSSVRHWYEPLQHATQDYQKAYNIGLESGNLQYAVYAFGHNMYCRFYQGINLSELSTEVDGYLTFCRSRKNQWGIDLMEAGQLVIFNLMGKWAATTEFSKPDLTEAQFVERAEAHKNIQVLCIFYILKTQALYLHGHFEQALESAKEAENRIISVATQGLLPSSAHRFIESLLLLALYPQVSPTQQKAYWKKLIANEQLAKIWVDNCPANFQPQYLLMLAEMASISEPRKLETLELYDQAIASAKKHSLNQYEALGNELAARFLLTLGKEKIARPYLKEAHYHYQQWGAIAKVKSLAEQYSQWLTKEYSSDMSTTFTNTLKATILPSTRTQTSTSQWLDIESVMKAAQTLSGEIMLNQLLAKMMRIVIENAGAQRGFLILPHNDNWVIEAEGAIDTTEITVLHSLPIENHLPEAIISYVARTQENVVLSDARQKGLYTENSYIKTHQTQSVLCFPIVYQQQLRAILYFENNLTTGAFTPKHLNVLKMLSSQIAISLENARFVKELEAARHLAEIANQTKTAFLANVSHELRTPLNSILGYVQLFNKNIELPSSVREGHQIIQQSGEYLLMLINDIIDISTVNIDKTPLALMDVRLDHLLNNLVQIFQHRAHKKGLKFKVCYTSELPVGIITDEKRLRQILNHLLSNAVKFTQQGKITFTVTLHEDKIRFSVADTGIGISAENLEKIFLPFEQISDWTHKSRGAGLGLSLADKLVRALGGKVHAESQIGQGSRFWVDLPLTKSRQWQKEKLELTLLEEQTTDTLPLLEASLKLLSPKQIATLYNLGRDGDIRGMMQQADVLEQLDPQFMPLVEKIREITKTYNTDSICDLLIPFIGEM